MSPPELKVSNRSNANSSDDDSRDLPDVKELAQQYLIPIDNLRSIIKPTKGHSTNVSNEESPVKLTVNQYAESRAHAFFRMLGLPIGVDEEYYNPGFPEPPGSKEKRIAINQKVIKELEKIVDVREAQQQKISALFFNNNVAGSIYAYLLRFQRPFAATISGTMIDEGPYSVTEQKYEVTTRADQLTILLNSAKGDGKSELEGAVSTIKSAIGGIAAGQHILRPFVVDPDIAATVMPDSKLICVPFLKTKDETMISKEPNTHLLRPGIEAILRSRLLSSKTVGAEYIAQAKKYLNNETSLEVTDNISESLQLINSLAEDQNITEAIEQEISSYVNFQLRNLTKLVKLMIHLVRELVEYQQDIDKAQQEIGWLPVPNPNGPEFGSSGASSRAVPGSVGSEIDALIAALNLKIFATKYTDQSITELGEFASPFQIQPEDITQYNNKLSELKQYKDRIGNQALEAMGAIELIMGEVSGLGLMDVLAVYYAIWAMEEKYLLAFLDNDAFGRLVAEGLTSVAIQERAGGNKATLESALTDLETRVGSVLAYMDRVYEQMTNNAVAE